MSEHSSSYLPQRNIDQEREVDGKHAQKHTFLHRIKNIILKDRKPRKGDQNVQSNSLPPISFWQLFHYATPRELTMLVLASFSASVHGVLVPLFAVLLGAMLDVLGNQVGNSPESETRIISESSRVAKWFLVLGGVAFVTGFIQVRFAILFSQRVCSRLRKLYVQSLISQDFAWYDKSTPSALAARVASDVSLIEAGLGDKLTSGVQFTVMLISGFIVAFCFSWKLTLINIFIAPVLAVAFTIFAKVTSTGAGAIQEAYATAGGIAHEVLSLIRVVTAYNGQQSEASRYDQNLERAYKSTIRNAIYKGLSFGFTSFCVFCAFAIAFAFGAAESRKKLITPGDVIVTFFGVFIGTLSLGQRTYHQPCFLIV